MMSALEKAIADISPDFAGPVKSDSRIFEKLLQHEATAEAIKVFAQEARKLSNYGYWFGLSALWVSYSGWSDLELWKRLMSSPRPNRQTSMMKPSELRAFLRLPERIKAYRAHRPAEIDWISYALDPLQAALFARRRGVDRIAEYTIERAAALCLSLRRGETELLVLDKNAAKLVRWIDVVVAAQDDGGVEDCHGQRGE